MSENNGARAALTIPVALVVMIAWISSLGIGALTNNFVPLTITTPVMLLLAGYVFGVQIVKGAKGEA